MPKGTAQPHRALRAPVKRVYRAAVNRCWNWLKSHGIRFDGWNNPIIGLGIARHRTWTE